MTTSAKSKISGIVLVLTGAICWGIGGRYLKNCFSWMELRSIGMSLFDC